MNNATTFNVGDKVRITDIGIYNFVLLLRGGEGAKELKANGIVQGNTGTVTATGITDDGEGSWVHVRTDNAERPHDSSGKGGWAFYPDELEKVEG